MKINKIVFICLVFCGLMAFSLGAFVNTASAQSEPPWYDCIVERAGTNWIELTDSLGAFSHKWYLYRTDQKKEMLAMGLTCLSNDYLIHARITNPNDYLTLLELYVIRPSE